MPAQSKTRNRKSKIARSAWAKIRLFAMDVDGVLTDGTVSISSDGSEAKAFSLHDGAGIVRLLEAGVAVAWISGRPSKVTTRRAAELKVPHLIQGRADKLEALQELATRLGLAAEQCVYMGDDYFDAPAIAWAGIGAAPSEATSTARVAASYVARCPAGRGAVREVCDLILAAQARNVSA